MFPVPSLDELEDLVEDDLDEDTSPHYSSPFISSDISINEEKRVDEDMNDDAPEDEKGIMQIGIGSGRGRTQAVEYVEDSDGEGASWGSSMGR